MEMDMDDFRDWMREAISRFVLEREGADLEGESSVEPMLMGIPPLLGADGRRDREL
jgi:hypothetical protein